jgi:hypothetical protein
MNVALWIAQLVPVSHGSLREYPQASVNLALLAVCVFVAIGRFAG